MRRIVCGVSLSSLLIFAGCAVFGHASRGRYEYTELHMGSPVRIVLYAASPDEALSAARAAFGEVAADDATMSDYDPRSELSRLNDHAGLGPQTISPRLFAALAAARRFAEITGGAFDPTVGPVVLLWREARATKRLPDPDALRDAVARVGYAKLVLDDSRRTASLEKTGMRLDLGGIGKGIATDHALAALTERGMTRALVGAAGDIALGEPPPRDSGWNIAAPGAAFLLASRRGISTSGDTEQFLEIGGHRYSHIVDPRTGLGVENVETATIIAPDATTSDALATAVAVLGRDAGLALCRRLPGIEARIRWREADGDVSEAETEGFLRHRVSRR